MATVDKGGTVTLQELLVTSSPFLHRALCLKTTFIRLPHPCPSAARPTPWERSSPILALGPLGGRRQKRLNLVDLIQQSVEEEETVEETVEPVPEPVLVEPSPEEPPAPPEPKEEPEQITEAQEIPEPVIPDPVPPPVPPVPFEEPEEEEQEPEPPPEPAWRRRMPWQSSSSRRSSSHRLSSWRR